MFRRQFHSQCHVAKHPSKERDAWVWEHSIPAGNNLHFLKNTLRTKVCRNLRHTCTRKHAFTDTDQKFTNPKFRF